MAVLSAIGVATAASFGVALAAGSLAAIAVGAIVAAVVIGTIGLLLTPNIPGQGDLGSPQDNTGNKSRVATDPNNLLPIPYGFTRTAGTFTYGDNSENEEKLAVICALGHGDIDKINRVTWDDSVLQWTSSNFGPSESFLDTVTNSVGRDGVTDDFLDGNLKMKSYPAGGRCTEMETFSSDKWGVDSANRTMPNTPYVYMELEFDADKQVFDYSQKIFFHVQGRKIKSIESDGTLSATTSFSNNPAECLLDYMTDELSGCNIPLRDINVASFYNHKVYCNEPITYVEIVRTWTNGDQYSTGQRVVFGGKTYQSLLDDNGAMPSGATDANWTLVSNSAQTSFSGTAKRFTTNGTVATGDDMAKNLDYLTAGNNGILNYNNGKWQLLTRTDSLTVAGSFVTGQMYVIKTPSATDFTSVGAANNSAGTLFTATGAGSGTGTADAISALLDESNILGSMDITGTNLNDLTNRLTLKYRSKEDYNQTNQVIIDLRDSTNEFYTPSVVNESEPFTEKTRGLPFTNNSIETKRCGAQIINENRQGTQLRVTTTFANIIVEAGDIVAVRHRTPGWGFNADQTAHTAPKLFRTRSVKEGVRNNTVVLEFGCSEYASESYADDGMINEDDPAPNTTYRQFNSIPGVGSVTLTDTSRTINGVPVSSLRLNWTDTDPFLAQVESRYIQATTIPMDPTWIAGPTSQTDNMEITDLLPSTDYIVQYRIISKLNNIGVWNSFSPLAVTTQALSAITDGADGASVVGIKSGSTATAVVFVNSNGADVGPAIDLRGAIGPDGYRQVSGTLYYTISQASQPSSPTATSIDYTTSVFTSLSANWSSDPQTIIADQSDSYWQCRFNAVETSDGMGGITSTITFGTVVKVATFENLLTGTLTATQSIKAGNIEVDAEAELTTGSGALLTGGGDFTVGDTSHSISFDASTGLMKINGEVVTGRNIQIGNNSLAVDDDGKLIVGYISSNEVLQTGDKTVSIDNSGTDGSNSAGDFSTGGTGGNGTDFFLATTGDIQVNSLNTSGGDGGNSAGDSSTGGLGGNGGQVVLFSDGGNITITSILASGGDGGTAVGDGATSGGDGGDGGTINVRAPDGCVTGFGSAVSAGGAAGGGNSSGTPGTGGSKTEEYSEGNTCAT